MQPEWYAPRSTIHLPDETSAPDQIDRDLARAVALAAALDDNASIPSACRFSALLAAVDYRVLADVQVWHAFLYARFDYGVTVG